MRAIFRDPALQHRFEVDGYVVVELVTADDIGRLVELHDAHSADIVSSNAWSYTAQSSSPAGRKAMSDGIRGVLQPRLDAVLERCRAVIGNFFHKQPARDDSTIHLHQDWSWVDEWRHHSLTVWCPFQEVNTDNGTLALVPGSHRLGAQPRGYVTCFPYPDLQQLLTTKYSRHLTLRPGQAVLFHQRLFHWSGPNRTTERRLAANCFVAPVEAALAYPHPDPQAHPGRIELLEVDDDLLTSFVPGVRPPRARRLGLVDAEPALLNEQILERVLGGGCNR